MGYGAHHGQTKEAAANGKNAEKKAAKKAKKTKTKVDRSDIKLI
jgi:hypothetical protein